MPDSPRIAVITGGARGIGLGIARRLQSEGWQLFLNGMRDESAVADVLNELAALGSMPHYVAADVGTDEGRHRIVSQALQAFGRIDALVNNAGITSPGRKDILDADEESFDRVIATNLKGPFFLAQLAARQMIEQEPADPTRRGKIVFISSISGEFVSTNRGDYCITKAALAMVTKLWAARLAEHGIDVYEVSPGVIRSDMTAGAREKYDRLIGEGLTLEPRWGEPDDVGRAVAMLLRGDLTYATGQSLHIDGGMRVRRM
jgi:NAD(P)-dependent dehydrogenase (short-subunit alcohol dehydrogenase family)